MLWKRQVDYNVISQLFMLWCCQIVHCHGLYREKERKYFAITCQMCVSVCICPTDGSDTFSSLPLEKWKTCKFPESRIRSNFRIQNIIYPFWRAATNWALFLPCCTRMQYSIQKIKQALSKFNFNSVAEH